MALRTLILLHGYGVRSFFWEPIRTFFESRFSQIFIPDLQMDNPTVLLESTKEYVLNIKNKYDTDLFVVGHSLGGVVGALLAQELGPTVINKVVIIASPYGEQTIPFKNVVRFLIKHQLIPGFLSRPRFFSKKTPKSVQKRLFKQVVPETEAMIDEILKEKYFHTDLIKGELPQDCLFFMSEYDKVVPVKSSLAFATRLGASTEVYPKTKKVAHDDYIAAPIVSQEVASKITNFLLGEKWS